MNEGERGEILIKIRLTEMREKEIALQEKRVSSVGFPKKNGGFTEYSLPKSILRPDGKSVDPKIRNFTDGELHVVAGEANIEKAKTCEKSDVYINGTGYSVKSVSGAAPALINHTSRPGFERVCKKCDVDIEELDKMVDRYWELRLKGAIGEDIKNSDMLSPFRDGKKVLVPILRYFLSEGSGSKETQTPAEYIIEYREAMDEKTWKIMTPEDVIEKMWSKLIFSIRSKKGMPADYNPQTYKKEDAASIFRWVRECDGDYRGALHVRLKG